MCFARVDGVERVEWSALRVGVCGGALKDDVDGEGDRHGRKAWWSSALGVTE